MFHQQQYLGSDCNVEGERGGQLEGILVHDAYDIPKITSDGVENFDASEYVYDYILCSICPVKLTKPGLCYNAETNHIQDRIRDWLVQPPELGFLFPSFNDRNMDIHSLLYYSKNSDELDLAIDRKSVV